MTHECWLWCNERTIPSRWEDGQTVVEEIAHRLAEHDWDARDRFGISLALTEAVVNAIRHGNRQDSSKRVRVECKLSHERVWIEVSDEGGGFDPCAVPDCTELDRLELPTGRGLMLMKVYMTQVEYNATGNAVVLVKERDNGTA